MPVVNFYHNHYLIHSCEVKDTDSLVSVARIIRDYLASKSHPMKSFICEFRCFVPTYISDDGTEGEDNSNANPSLDVLVPGDLYIQEVECYTIGDLFSLTDKPNDSSLSLKLTDDVRVNLVPDARGLMRFIYTNPVIKDI